MCLAAICSQVATPVAAQAVSVMVTNAETLRPVVGALVHLVDQSDTQVRRALTDEGGRARFIAFGTGEYRLRAEMVGMATAESELFLASPDRTVQQEIVLTPRPIVLEGLAVRADARCRTGPAQGLATAQVWEEARKALTATAVTDELGLYRYQTMLYERDLDRDTRVIRRTEESRREATMRTPFRSRPAEDLIDRGFVEPSGDRDLYFAPDANVLLSDAFLDTHCFRLRLGAADGETEGLVGLAFEPTGDRDHVTDIAGTLWLDPGTSELEWLEYRYTNLDPDIRRDEIGGRVEFERMPEGGWIVDGWWIRMPSLELQRNLNRDRLRTYVAGYREAGGLVLQAQRAGRSAGHRSLGGLEGTVLDSIGMTLEGVRVEVVGSAHEAVSDSSGIFRISGLVGGIYQVRFVDPRLESYGFAPQPVTRAVFHGEVSRVDFQMPSAAAVLADMCGTVPILGPEWEDLPIEAHGTGILVGWVRDVVTDEPVPGAIVRALTYRYEFAPGSARGLGSRPRGSIGGPPAGPRNVEHTVSLGGLDPNEYAPVVHRGMFGFETVTNDDGFFRICRVPERELVSVVALYDGVEIDAGRVRIREDGGVAVHTVPIAREW